MEIYNLYLFETPHIVIQDPKEPEVPTVYIF